MESVSSLAQVAAMIQERKAKNYNPLADVAGSMAQGIGTAVDRQGQMQARRNPMEEAMQMIKIGHTLAQIEAQKKEAEDRRNFLNSMVPNKGSSAAKDAAGQDVHSVSGLMQKQVDDRKIKSMRYGDMGVTFESTDEKKDTNTQKELPDFEKGQKLRELVAKEQSSYRQSMIEDIPPDVQTRWNIILEKANKLQGLNIPTGITPAEPIEEDDDEGGLWDSIWGAISGKKKKKMSKQEDPFDIMGD
jgi:hypothetical protein